MSRILLIIITLFSAVFTGCYSDRQQLIMHSFPNNTWHRFTKLDFEYSIKNLKKTYDLNVIIHLTEDFQYNSIPIHFIFTSPSGEERIWEQTLVVKSGGSFLGKKKGRVYEIIIPLRTKHRFMEQGIHKLNIEQFIPKYDTHGVVAFGTELRRN